MCGVSLTGKAIVLQAIGPSSSLGLRSIKLIGENKVEIEYPIEKWFWKMDFCKTQGISPAQTWAWDLAEKQYQAMINPTELEGMSMETNGLENRGV